MTIQEMLAELKAFGLSQREIAETVGTTQPTIHRATKGAGVSYETGKAIEKMHQKAKAIAKATPKKTAA